jgi:hypothetical protein
MDRRTNLDDSTREITVGHFCCGGRLQTTLLFSRVFLEREIVFLFYSVLLTDSLTKHEIKKYIETLYRQAVAAFYNLKIPFKRRHYFLKFIFLLTY